MGAAALLTGKLDADAELQSAGASAHELAAAANGRLRLALGEGRLDTAKAGGIVAAVLNAIRAGTDRLETGESPLRCAVLALDLAAGVATIAEAGIDAPRLLGVAAGSVNLGKETMALRLRPNLRNASALAPVPLRLDDGWRDARLGPDSGALPRPATEGCGTVAAVPAPATGARAPMPTTLPTNRSP